MFDSNPFIGAPSTSKQAASNPLHARLNPDSQATAPAAIPQEEWKQVEVPPQIKPELNQPVEEAKVPESEIEAAAKTAEPADEDRKYFEHLPKPLPEETILTWRSASRPFKKRNRQFYTTVATIVILISLILFFAGQFLPIAVVISIAFLSYVLSSVPPHENEKKITTYGIRVEDELYYWEEMGRFWFEEKYGSSLLQIEIIRFPGRLTLLTGDLSNQELEDILKEVLIKEKPADTFFDKSAAWLQEKIPLDKDA